MKRRWDQRASLVCLSLLTVLVLLYGAGCKKTVPTLQAASPASGFKPLEVVYEPYIQEVEGYTSSFKSFRPVSFSFECPNVYQTPKINPRGDSYYLFDVFEVELSSVSSTYYGLLKPAFRIKEQNSYCNHPTITEINWLADGLVLAKSEKTTIDGIEASYFERVTPPNEKDNKFALIEQTVTFKYGELDWSISMTWVYEGPEPPGMRHVFQHIIDTFKVDKSIANPVMFRNIIDYDMS